MSDDPRRRRPASFRVEDDEPPATRPQAAAEDGRHAQTHTRRRPAALPATVEITPDAEDPFLGAGAGSGAADGAAEAEAELAVLPEAVPRRRRFSFARLAAGGFALLVSIAIGLWIDGLVRALFERADWLGWATLAVTATAGLALAAALLREAIALSRLQAVQSLKREVGAAADERAPARARRAVKTLARLVETRPETAAGRRTLDDLEGEIVDGPALIALAEQELMGPLDRRARRLILEAARRTSVVTAVSPRALIDVGYVIFEVARLVRAVATLYGGRPGALGLLRLLRDVVAHLAVTGSIAVGDGLVQQVVGHGLAARVSARLGEGVVNGLMTARLGIAAMDLCRPMPFRALSRPRMADFLSDLTTAADPTSHASKRRRP